MGQALLYLLFTRAYRYGSLARSHNRVSLAKVTLGPRVLPAAMLGIPFINQYIQRVVKEQTVADSVDWLNYYVTSLLLAFFSLAISAKQYFGSPIQCWVPNEFRGGWEKYAEDYCFIANSYHVPWEEEIPGQHEERHDQISYYRWVPIVLALQAVCFFMPNWIWNMLHKQTAVNPRSVVGETLKCKDLHGDDRAKEVKNVATYIHETIEVFEERGTIVRSGSNATILYLATKLFFVMNIIVQFYLINHFLGGDYMNWGWETLKDIYFGKEWVESPIFPRVIMCDFEVRRLANRQRHTVQCVIMMNMINEKLYLFLYVWFIFVGIVTFVNFLYNVALFSLPMMMRAVVQANMSKEDLVKYGNGKRDAEGFVKKYLKADGVLLLQFIRQNVGGRVTRELLGELFRLHMQKKNDMYLADEYSPESVRAGKRPSKMNYTQNLKNAHPGYQPSTYGPNSIYPGIEEPDTGKLTVGTPRKQPESSAPPSEDLHSYDDGTLPIGALVERNPMENIYTTSHVADV
ncbi:hypothetical protein L596_019885 [Steinernema carpocapsae]|uniref:Innexin n=1 Tax=Steinernema carpocapsae TaxID=34508 RepID=A0A4U5MSH5_STECR|nr:hypothetical protein L596_019885 [Steinernema carpocapsae]